MQEEEKLGLFIVCVALAAIVIVHASFRERPRVEASLGPVSGPAPRFVASSSRSEPPLPASVTGSAPDAAPHDALAAGAAAPYGAGDRYASPRYARDPSGPAPRTVSASGPSRGSSSFYEGWGGSGGFGGSASSRGQPRPQPGQAAPPDIPSANAGKKTASAAAGGSAAAPPSPTSPGARPGARPSGPPRGGAETAGATGADAGGAAGGAADAAGATGAGPLKDVGGGRRSGGGGGGAGGGLSGGGGGGKGGGLGGAAAAAAKLAKEAKDGGKGGSGGGASGGGGGASGGGGAASGGGGAARASLGGALAASAGGQQPSDEEVAQALGSLPNVQPVAGEARPDGLQDTDNHFSSLPGGPANVITAAAKTATGATVVAFTSGLRINSNGSGGWHALGNGQPQTALQTAAGESLNPAIVPFIALPADFAKAHPDVQLGDYAAVSYGGKTVYALVGDKGPAGVLGGGSLLLASSLGINPHPRRGGAPANVRYVILAGSRDRTPPATGADVQARAGEQFRRNSVLIR